MKRKFLHIMKGLKNKWYKYSIKYEFLYHLYPCLWQSSLQVLSAAQRANCLGDINWSLQTHSVFPSWHVPPCLPRLWHVAWITNGSISELDRIVNMDRLPNTELFGFWKFYKYQIIRFLKMNEYRILNSTIWSQLFEYWILKIE